MLRDGLAAPERISRSVGWEEALALTSEASALAARWRGLFDALSSALAQLLVMRWPLGLGVLLLGTRAHAASLELLVPSSGAQRALAVELSPDGLWFNACSAATCSARDGRRWEVPPQALARAGSGSLEVLTLGPERRAAHVRIPVSADGDWEAIIAAGAGSAQPSVPFAGMTGAIEGEDGQRSGDLVWVRNDEKGQRVLVGRVREDVQLCGRPTLLEPRLLDKDAQLRPVKVQQLTLEERRAATVLAAVRAGAPTRGGNALRAVAASSALGDPGALTDARDDSTWSEARGGDGRGEFVVLRALSGVNLVAFEFLVRQSSGGSSAGGAPRSLWLATRGRLYRADFQEDAWRSPGVWYRVELPAPIQADCVAVVLEQAYSERPDVEVTLAEVRGVGDLQAREPAELVARLSTPGEEGAAVVPALLQLGDASVAAVLGAFGALDATGRARALDVLENAPCETTASVYADVLDDEAAENQRRAGQRLRGCGASAEPALRRAFELGSGDAGVRLARELASVAPALAVELLGPRLAAAPGEQRASYRDALSRAAREPAATDSLRRLLDTPGLGTAADVEVLRALSERLPALVPESSHALERATGGARSFEQRYLLLAPASRLAPADPGAARFVEAALKDPDPYLRASAARVAPSVASTLPLLASAARDAAVRVREAAALRLGELGPAAAAPVLTERLAGDDWPLVRRAAAGALASVGPSAAVDAALLSALADAAPGVRSAALRGLGARRVRSAVPAIAERLGDGEEVAPVRAAAVAALADLCDTTQLDALTRAAQPLLADRPAPDDVIVAGAALAALGRIAPADLETRLAPFAARADRPGLVLMVDAARQAERCSASPAR
jgi:HEAT repeat protein